MAFPELPMLLVVAGVALLAPVLVVAIVVLAVTVRAVARLVLHTLSEIELFLTRKLDDWLPFERFVSPVSPAQCAEVFITGTLAVWLSCLFVFVAWTAIDGYAPGMASRDAIWITILMFGVVWGSLSAVLCVDRVHQMRMSKRATSAATAGTEPKKRTLVGPLVSYATVSQTNPST